MGDGAIAILRKVSCEVYCAGKVHRESADKAEVIGEIASTNNVEVADKVKVVDDMTGAHTGAGECAGKVAGPVTGTGIGEVTSEVVGDVSAAGKVERTIEVERQFLHAVSKAGELKYRTGSHRQPRPQIP